jgi:hypothetical protein
MNLKEGFKRIFFSIGILWFIFFISFAVYNFFASVGINPYAIYYNFFFATTYYMPNLGTSLNTYRSIFIDEKEKKDMLVYYLILISFIPFFIFEVKNIFGFLKRITILLILFVLPIIYVILDIAFYNKILIIGATISITYAFFKFLDYIEEGFLKKNN